MEMKRIRVVPNGSKFKELAIEFLKENKEVLPEEPFFLCNLSEIRRKYEEWTKAFPRIKPFYAVKCNNDDLVVQLLGGLGTGFDCASQNEIKQVIDLGIENSQIIFANPTKIEEHIKTAKSYNVSFMTFDNVDELRKVNALYPTARLLLRVRCDANEADILVGAKAGALMTDVPELLSTAHALGLNVIGGCFHVGSNCRDSGAYRRGIALVKEVFTMGTALGFNMSIVDIGGGFPGFTGTDLTDISNVVNKAIDDFFPEIGSGIKVMAEPGRFFVTSAFYSFTQIHSKRKGKNEVGDQSFTYYVNDGIFGNFMDIILNQALLNPQILRDESRDFTLIPSSIWGQTCHGLDQICNQVMLPEMNLSEWLMFDDRGAYKRTLATTFNGFPIAKSYYFSNEEDWGVIKEILAGKTGAHSGDKKRDLDS